MKTTIQEKKAYLKDLEFTRIEKEVLYGLSKKIAKKRKCSGMYVRYIINGERAINTTLAQSILKDLKDLLELLRPEE